MLKWDLTEKDKAYVDTASSDDEESSLQSSEQSAPSEDSSAEAPAAADTSAEAPTADTSEEAPTADTSEEGPDAESLNQAMVDVNMHTAESAFTHLAYTDQEIVAKASVSELLPAGEALLVKGQGYANKDAAYPDLKDPELQMCENGMENRALRKRFANLLFSNHLPVDTRALNFCTFMCWVIGIGHMFHGMSVVFAWAIDKRKTAKMGVNEADLHACLHFGEIVAGLSIVTAVFAAKGRPSTFLGKFFFASNKWIGNNYSRGLHMFARKWILAILLFVYILWVGDSFMQFNRDFKLECHPMIVSGINDPGLTMLGGGLLVMSMCNCLMFKRTTGKLPFCNCKKTLTSYGQHPDTTSLFATLGVLCGGNLFLSMRIMFYKFLWSCQLVDILIPQLPGQSGEGEASDDDDPLLSMKVSKHRLIMLCLVHQMLSIFFGPVLHGMLHCYNSRVKKWDTDVNMDIDGDVDLKSNSNTLPVPTCQAMCYEALSCGCGGEMSIGYKPEAKPKDGKKNFVAWEFDNVGTGKGVFEFNNDVRNSRNQWFMSGNGRVLFW